ncbi:MAG TPA: hypothetical protein VNT02_10010 [Burkholderiales bacterium]|nr:hypothetical protein [Burkholderiales bacterium]
MTDKLEGSARHHYGAPNAGAAGCSWFLDEWGFRYLSKRFGIGQGEFAALMQRTGGCMDDMERELVRARSSVGA